MSIPIIDIGALMNDLNNKSKNNPEIQKIVNEISNACRYYGFFYIINHGIPDEQIQQVFEEEKIFFFSKSRRKGKNFRLQLRIFIGVIIMLD